MPQRIAKFVTIIWEDDSYETYTGVVVEEHRSDRKMAPNAVPDKYKTMTVTDKKRVR